MRLFIAEKPNLAKAIVDGLGGGEHHQTHYVCGDDVVTWCIGHMLEPYEPADYDSKYKKWSLDDLPIYHSPIKYKVKSKTKAQFGAILSLIKQSNSIVHCGDNDAHGQLIVDEILTCVGYQKPVQRFITNDNNLRIVQRALANLTDNKKYYGLYQSAFAQSIGDQLYGFNMSRAYTLFAQECGYDGVLSVGRVQTPILGLVVNRDRANANHEKQFYFDIMGDFQFSSFQFSAKYCPADDAPIDDKNRLVDKSFANNIAIQCQGNTATIANVKIEIKELSPPLPYNMLKLQVDASKKFNYKPDQVMKITQELREKYRLITYNGSDCQYLNEEQHAEVGRVLKAISHTAIEFTEPVTKTDPTIKSRAFNNNNVSAHHAIIPTEAIVDLTTLSEPLRNIYLIIAQAYVAQFYPKQQYQETKISIDCAGHTFSVSSKIILKDGWTVLYKKLVDDDAPVDDFIALDLASLNQSDIGICQKSTVLNKETKPLPLYTMASLLIDLTRIAKYIKDPGIKKLLVDKDKDKKGEHGGIGTSRTRDVIIKKLFDIGFLIEKGKKVISSSIGQQFFNALPEIATSPDMTALWHEQQLMIEQGSNTAENFINELMVFIGNQIDDLKLNGLEIKIKTHKCSKCQDGILKKIKGSNGVFWGCNRYPECKTSLPDKAGKPDYKSLETYSCPDCNKPMKRRKRTSNNQKGFFWACTGYPECKKTLSDCRGKPDTKPTDPLDITKFNCGQCSKSLIRRISIKGKGKLKKETVWYGCAGFPTCKQTYFDRNGEPKF